MSGTDVTAMGDGSDQPSKPQPPVNVPTSTDTSNFTVKIKDEPHDWTLDPPPTSQCCASDFPQSGPATTSGLPPPFLNSAPNGGIPHTSACSLPPPYLHGPPHHIPHNGFPPPPPFMANHANGAYPNPTGQSGPPNQPMPGMPMIKNEPVDPNYPPYSWSGPAPNLPPPPVQVKQEPGTFSEGNPMPPWSSSSTATSTSTTATASEATGKKQKGGKKEKKVTVKKEIKQEKITDAIPQKKKRDRFKGMTEEEVLKRVLPDHLKEGLDIAIIGINPGLCAAYVGHHYAGPGNHFWKCLLLSGLIPEPMNAYDDHRLLDYGIGFTNIVERTSRGSADLSKKEIKEGGEILQGKIEKYKPKIAVFNGKGIYEVFCGHKRFNIGKQPDHFPGCPETLVYVMPSSSARFTQLPRAVDKVPFYLGLKKLRDHLRGDIKQIEESEVSFPDLDLKVVPRADKIKTEPGAEVKTEPGTEPVEKKKRGRKRKSVDNQVLDGVAMNAMLFPGQQPEEGGPGEKKKKGKKRKSVDNEVLDSVAMNAMLFPQPPTSQGMPNLPGYPPTTLPQTSQGMPNFPGFPPTTLPQTSQSMPNFPGFPPTTMPQTSQGMPPFPGLPLPPTTMPHLPTMSQQFPPGMPPPLPSIAEMPPHSQASLDQLFSTPPVLVKQEDLSELANFGINQAMLSGQAFFGGCPPPPQVPTTQK